MIVSIPSPNYTKGRFGYKPIAIVIHIMEGTLHGTDSWFQNPSSKVSAHYGIGKNGEIHQYVNENDTAWHAGRVANPTWSLIISKGVNKYINPNYYTIGIEHEGYGDTEWTAEMYQSSSEMIKSIAAKWGIPINRDHIIGHHEIYAVKTCPGTKVDFNKLIALATGSVTVQTAYDTINEVGKATTQSKINLRVTPNRNNAPIAVVDKNVQLAYDGYITNGESVNGNSKWYFTHEGNWFWSGAVQ